MFYQPVTSSVAIPEPRPEADRVPGLVLSASPVPDVEPARVVVEEESVPEADKELDCITSARHPDEPVPSPEPAQSSESDSETDSEDEEAGKEDKRPWKATTSSARCRALPVVERVLPRKTSASYSSLKRSRHSSPEKSSYRSPKRSRYNSRERTHHHHLSENRERRPRHHSRGRRSRSRSSRSSRHHSHHSRSHRSRSPKQRPSAPLRPRQKHHQDPKGLENRTKKGQRPSKQVKKQDKFYKDL